MKYIERIFNAETGETVDIEKEYTAEELKIIKENEEQTKIKVSEIAQKAQKRQEILDRLGLTEEEVAVLLG